MSKVGPAYKDNGLDTTPLADSGINKRLIKRHSLFIKRVLSSAVGYFIVCYFHHKYTTKLLNRVAPSVELMMQK